MKDADLDVLLKKNPEVDRETIEEFMRKQKEEGTAPRKRGPELPSPYDGKRMILDDASTWNDAPAIHYRSR